MKKRLCSLLLCLTITFCMTGCANTQDADSASEEEASQENSAEETASQKESESAKEEMTEETAEELAEETTEELQEEAETTLQYTEKETTDTPLEIPEGMYLSELTGLPIDEELAMQRPIAVMVDNESTALPHYGTASADIVYEMINSTANNRITRLMCIYKDWEDLQMVGSIRSVRPTNILLAQEYYAVICHDGGPYYINDYFSRYPYHFSGTFSRVDNGKATEFTEYILSGDLDDNFESSGYSKEYEESPSSHFNFTDYGTTVDLDDWDADGIRPADTIELPFYHNSSKLLYNEQTGTYDYYEYGSRHEDADTGEPLTFTNVLLQDCSFTQLDDNGYLIYNCIDRFQLAYYCTGGECISILWSKEGESEPTKFYDLNGEEIEINPGKTYIGLVPDDSWDEVYIY